MWRCHLFFRRENSASQRAHSFLFGLVDCSIYHNNESKETTVSAIINLYSDVKK